MKWRLWLIPIVLLTGCGLDGSQGGRLAISTYYDDNWEVVVVDLDLDAATRLSNNSAYDFEPVWSPDGTRIAWTSDYLEGKILDVEVPLEGGGFTTETKEELGDRNIMITTTDGTGAFGLGLPGVNDEQPAWSPDGMKLAFVSERSGAVNIWVMDNDGSNEYQISDNPREDWMPSWSPDGSTIAFTSKQTGTWEINIVDSDGGNLRQITDSEAGVDNWGPVWSPDGNRIAFARMLPDGWEVFTMSAEGTDVSRLTNRPGTDFEPVWSPDGNRIAFASDRGGKTAVYLMDADGSDVEKLGVAGIPSDWTTAP